MASWVTDNDLYHDARSLGDKIIEMFDKVDIPLPYAGADMKDPHYVIYSSLVADAEDYLSLDPQKITDEYVRIQKAASEINDGTANDDLDESMHRSGHHGKIEGAHKVGDRTVCERVEFVTNKVTIDDNAATPVIDSYVRARDQLRRSYEDGLNQLRDWLNQQDSLLGGEKLELLEPLAAYCDVDSPDFSYENFFSEHHDKSDYAPKVEQERKKYVEEKPHSNGVIRQRLEGVE